MLPFVYMGWCWWCILEGKYRSFHRFLQTLCSKLISSASPVRSCIKWVQESFPAGGESSGLVVIYEQCVRAFWHDERYKGDLRYLKVWLEYVSC